jgi:SNF2 family DNA or RNA helicase
MPKYVRETRELLCPKDAALKALLEENEEQGRIVVFAGFTGSVDRCVRLCHEEGWDVVRCDGRGWQVTTHKGEIVAAKEPLDYWSDLASHPRIAFVSHPESGGMSLTLTESRMEVYWSNSWKPEYRTQSEDRIHRIGADMNKGVTIVDLIHLPSDERVLEVIRANRRLERMSMGEVMTEADWDGAKGTEGEIVSVDMD